MQSGKKIMQFICRGLMEKASGDNRGQGVRVHHLKIE